MSEDRTVTTAREILVYYAAFRDHYSLYPFTPGVVEALGEQIEPYCGARGRSGSTRGSGTRSG